jgi:hypothetical protein
MFYFRIDTLLDRFKTNEKVLEYIYEFYPELEVELDDGVLMIDGDLDEVVMFANHQEDDIVYTDEELENPLIHKNYRLYNGF